MIKHRKLFTHIKWALLLTIGVAVGCGSKADHLNKEGLHLYNKRKYDEAIVAFKKALDTDQKHYDAHFNLGAAYCAKNMADESISEMKKAIEVNPDEPKAHYNIAFAYIIKEKVDDAIAAYKKAIALYAAKKDKKEAEGYLYLAVAYSLIERHEESFNTCKKALEINPELADGHYFLGVCYYKKNLYDDAIAELKKAAELNPKEVKPHSILLAIYEKLGKTDEVIEERKIIRQLEMEMREQ